MSGILTLIKDLAPGLADVTTHGIVTESKKAVAKNGQSFISAVLTDKTHSVKVMHFDVKESNAPSIGMVVSCTGKTEEFNNQIQVVVSKWKILDLDPEEFVAASRFTREFLEPKLQTELDTLGGEVGEVTREVFAQVWEEFLTAPAAMKNHHAHARGLAEHTWSMVRIAHRVANHYNESYSGMIDRDLLIAGVFLHDLGKVLDYQRAGVVWETSLAGELVGHMAHCVVMIHDAAMAVLASPEVEQKLIHLVLSHHGQLDYGSPIKPKTMEALVLHHIDMLDAHAEMMRVALESTSDQITEYVRPLGVRCVR